LLTWDLTHPGVSVWIVGLGMLLIPASVMWLLSDTPEWMKRTIVLLAWVGLSGAMIMRYYSQVGEQRLFNQILVMLGLLPFLAALYWSWAKQTALAMYNPAETSYTSGYPSRDTEIKISMIEANKLNRALVALCWIVVLLEKNSPLHDVLLPLALMDTVFWLISWFILPLTHVALSQRALVQDLTDTLVLFAGVVENQGVDQALAAVADTTGGRTLFGREFSRILLEIRLGKHREEAYLDLAARYEDLPGLHTVVSLFSQQRQELPRQVPILDSLIQRIQEQASVTDARLAGEFGPNLLILVVLTIIPAMLLWLTGIGLI
jgi:hypothetical protein